MTGTITSLPPLIEQPPGNNSSNPAGLPGITYQTAVLNYPQTWTALQTFPAGNITLHSSDIIGTIPTGLIPTPTATTLGGVNSIAAAAHNWISSIDTAGLPHLSQPAFSDISGSVAASQLPNPGASSLGGVQSAAATAHQWINSISTSGVPGFSQPGFADISGSVASAQMPALTGDVTTAAGSVASSIAANAVTNAKLATMAAWTFKANNTGTSATPTDITIDGLTAKGSPGAGDELIIWDVAGSALKKATVGSVGTSAGVSSLNGQTGALTYAKSPGGRLTLSSGQPVMTSNVTAAGSIYYDTFADNQCPVYNGTTMVPLTIASDEISMGLSSTNVLAGNVYDVWAVNNAGSLALGVGPAWTSSTARGTGAGTSQVTFQNGIRTNAVSLTHVYGGAAGTTDYGPVSANQATLLGSFYANANGKLDMNFMPAGASGGTNNFLCLSNAYNRIEYSASCYDSKASWTYASTSWRQADASTANQINMLDCIGTSLIDASYQCGCTTSTGGGLQIGINRGTTSAPPIQALAYAPGGSSVSNVGPIAAGVFPPALGLQAILACEVAYSAAAQTFYGSGWGGSAGQTQGLIVKGYM